MRNRKMAAMTLDHPSLRHQINNKHHQTGVVVEEIEGLIKVYKDGHVERPQIVPTVDCATPPDSGVMSTDVMIDKFTNVWARFYVPRCSGKRPLLVYFHGGGFCVGSASWSCYHEFLTKLASKTACVIMSVNYRLAPENPLPAAYDDGFKALAWVKQVIHDHSPVNAWLTSKFDPATVFLAGDSAGANIAYNISARLDGGSTFRPLIFKGTILIQPFFGGESRTYSEKHMPQPPRSALTSASSDAYWRMSLPTGASRDHPWCNPTSDGAPRLSEVKLFPTLICVSEMDILKDRNMEFYGAMVNSGKKVEALMCKGVGHAFQILNKSQISVARTDELVGRIKAFIGRFS